MSRSPQAIVFEAHRDTPRAPASVVGEGVSTVSTEEAFGYDFLPQLASKEGVELALQQAKSFPGGEFDMDVRTMTGEIRDRYVGRYISRSDNLQHIQVILLEVLQIAQKLESGQHSSSMERHETLEELHDARDIDQSSERNVYFFRMPSANSTTPQITPLPILQPKLTSNRKSSSI